MHKIITLPNGVRIVYQHLSYSKSVSLGIYIKSGSVYETAENYGISHFIEHMFFKGTTTRTAFDIATESELLGGRLNAYTDRECICIYTKALPEDLNPSLELMCDMLLNSTFEAEAIETEKNVVLEELKMYEDNPEEYVHDILSEITYPSHPIGKPIIGNISSISNITKKQISEYINNRFCGENIVLSVAGSFDPDRLIEKASKLFENVLPCTKRYAIPIASFECGNMEIKRPVEQAHIAMAYEGYLSTNDEKYALNLVSNILGGSTNSRLFQNIRETLGLAYSVYSCPNVSDIASYTSVYAACAMENLELVKELIFKETENLYKNGICEKDLEFAKKQFLCSFVLSSENSGSLMASVGRQLLLLNKVTTDDEIINKIKSVNLDSVNKAAKLFNPHKVSTAIIIPG